MIRIDGLDCRRRHHKVIEASDSGSRIPGASLTHLSDRFCQADRTSTGSAGGTGLGLAIVRELVRTLGGTVPVRSRQGMGSTPTVTLEMDQAVGDHARDAA